MAIGALSVWFFYHQLNKKLAEPKRLKDNLLVPGLSTFLAFFFLYVLKMVPPVPLSLEYAGIYHRVERKDGAFILTYDRPAWKFWQNGAQDFPAMPGDKVFAYVEIFAPSKFKDQIMVKWYFKEQKAGWVQYDSIPLTISGGRDNGYRGYATKSNYTPGDWQIRAETSDGREIGRLSFEIEETASSLERNFQIDTR
jgi:hypothetical protein